VAKLDAMAVLKSLDKDDLEKQIEEAKRKVAEATAELRALESMERIRKIRAGEVLRKSPKKREKKQEADPPVTRDLAREVLNYLEVAGASKPATIAASIRADPRDVQLILEGNPDTFVKKPLAGNAVGFGLRR